MFLQASAITVKRGNFDNGGKIDNKMCLPIVRQATPVKGNKTVNFSVVVYVLCSVNVCW